MLGLVVVPPWPSLTFLATESLLLGVATRLAD